MTHKKAIVSTDIPAETESGFPEPFASQMGSSAWRGLSDEFGLTLFGVNLEVIEPNGQSALRHWHSNSEEFVYVLSGELQLVTNRGKQKLLQGMCVGFKAGIDDGHHLINESTLPASFIVIGSRVSDDEVFYPDDNLQWLETESGERVAADKLGKKY
ncbi:cupin domain-containing protein [Vibrio lamellibrachiae]|uniref:cupin domain-containing protein n=1 Tax=Vibrio lamellibrachiae TaxID=2910253 RepID=UPI003D0D9AAF